MNLVISHGPILGIPNRTVYYIEPLILPTFRCIHTHFSIKLLQYGPEETSARRRFFNIPNEPGEPVRVVEVASLLYSQVVVEAAPS